MLMVARRILTLLAVWIATVTLAPAAWASISPTVTLDQSAGTQAGSSANLGMDLKFAPTGSDSPKDLSLSLPPGLLSNASINGGACLHTSQPTAACQVGSGTATVSLSGLPITLNTTFDLVAPPKPGDLAGLVTMATVPLMGTQQLGSPGEISIRPASDPLGLGVNIVFKNLPNTFSGTSISLDELKSTFNGLRMPTTCPATPANIAVAADSYQDATQRSASAPLHVTGCSSLAFSPAFHLSVKRNAGDMGVQISTDVTQSSTPIQATAGTVKLTLPTTVLVPNLGPVLAGGVLCTNPSSGTCKTIGSATATSPLYPIPLIGKVFLTGSVSATGLVSSNGISIVFPPPFALTLAGKVDLLTGSTTFSNVPDIPQSDLNVTLDGGPDAVFAATCSPASGRASATLTSQDGTHTVVAPSPFTVSGCSANKPAARPRITSGSISGLGRGAPRVAFKLVAGTRAPKLRSFTVRLPGGLSFVKHRVHGRPTVTGVSVGGAKIKSLALVGGRLVVTLRSAVSGVSARIGPSALKESAALRSRARRHRTGSLKLTVAIKDAAGTTTTATLQVKHPT